MTDPLNLNRIELLARAIFAQMFPLTGTRASGTCTVTAPAGGGDVTLPKNTYLRPIVGGEAMDQRLYKVAPNPATADGSWLVPEDTALPGVAVLSNIGGAHQNLPAGSRFRFAPPFPGLLQDVALDAPITNGTNLCSPIFGEFAGGEALLRRMVFWQTMKTAESAMEFFQGGTGDFPALLMIWTRSVPLQGRTTGGAQGTTRAARGERIFREGFECFIGSGVLKAAADRRDQAMTAMQAGTALLTDSQRNVDDELLSSVAGIEITSRKLAVAGQAHYIYQFGFEANSTYERVERRVFGPWEKNHIQVLFPGHEAPEPTGTFEAVDVIDAMPTE